VRTRHFFTTVVVLAVSLAAPGVISAREAEEPPPQTSGPRDEVQQPEPPGVQAPAVVQSSVTPVPAPAPPVETGSATRASASASRSVSVGDYFYAPARLEVEVGEKIVWTNNGKVPEGHTVTGDGFDSGVFKEDETYALTLNSPGTYDYICTLHPNMKGSIEVAGRSSSGGSNGGSGDSERSGGSGSGRGADSGAGDGATTGPGSESAAVGSPNSGGGRNSLPASGSDTLLLALYGIVLIELGLAVAMISRYGWPRRRTWLRRLS
jgi:plastocyanin